MQQPAQAHIELPPAPARILSALRRAGFAAYAVGGCVRDSLRGVTPHDWDICTAARPEQVKACLPGRYLDAGLSHGTVTLLLSDGQYEITTFRADGAYSDGRRPDSVTYLQDVTGDLARRDFTINAMAYAPETGLVDPFGGRADLSAGRIRCVGAPRERFSEDALRILRALRFAAALKFSIDADTAAGMRACRALLTQISGERVRAELDGMLTGAGALCVLLGYPDVLGVCVPEILPCVGFDQHSPYHCYDVWEHTARAVAYAPPVLRVRLALLLHDLGKPARFTRGADGRGHFYGHPAESERIARAALRRLRYDGETLRRVCLLVRYHDADVFPTDVSARRWLSRLGAAQLSELIEVKRADAAAHAGAERKLAHVAAFEARVNAALADGACVSLRQLAVDGSDMLALGIPAGPEVGRALGALLSAVLEGTLPNERGALLAAARESLRGETPPEK